MCHEPIISSLEYYKYTLMGLISEARENDIKVGFRISSDKADNVVMIELLLTDNNTGELVEIKVWDKSLSEQQKLER